MDILGTLRTLWLDSGFAGFFADGGWKNLIMIGVACVLLYLGIVKKFEPLLLVGIAFGCLLTNIPGAGLYHPELWDQLIAGDLLIKEACQKQQQACQRQEHQHTVEQNVALVAGLVMLVTKGEYLFGEPKAVSALVSDARLKCSAIHSTFAYDDKIIFKNVRFKIDREVSQYDMMRTLIK